MKKRWWTVIQPNGYWADFIFDPPQTQNQVLALFPGTLVIPFLGIGYEKMSHLAKKLAT